MRKTMSRLRRAAATTAAVVLVASGAAVAGAPAAFAGNCTTVASHSFCGAVNNRTGRTMHITTTLGTGTTGKCAVWNSHGGALSSFERTACDQVPWGNGTEGGNDTGVDVDAFTFNSEGYHQRFFRFGPWDWRQKGVWTKIVDGQVADCRIGDSNAIWCTVLWQK